MSQTQRCQQHSAESDSAVSATQRGVRLSSVSNTVRSQTQRCQQHSAESDSAVSATQRRVRPSGVRTTARSQTQQGIHANILYLHKIKIICVRKYQGGNKYRDTVPLKHEYPLFVQDGPLFFIFFWGGSHYLAK